MNFAEARERRVKADDARPLPLFNPNIERISLPNPQAAKIEYLKLAVAAGA